MILVRNKQQESLILNECNYGSFYNLQCPNLGMCSSYTIIEQTAKSNGFPLVGWMFSGTG